MNLENKICNAFTYIEFDHSFDNYEQADTEGRGVMKLLAHWATVKEDYEDLSDYMSDQTITKMQAYVIAEM
ncbi:MAG: hypothetical protein GY951_02480 [Psychromonas sp.]|nr:hypothetical protein [Psychromonas sp.]